MKTRADVLREQVTSLDDEREALLGELNELTPNEERTAEQVEARAAEITARGKEILAERATKLELIAELDALAVERANVPKGPEFIRKPDPTDALNDRNASPQSIADAITRALEPNVESPENMAHVRKTLNRHRGDTDWARQILVRATPAYESAWAKMICGRHWDLTSEERTAMSTTTSANGDYLVPTHLDPTIILTNSGSSNVMRQYATIKTLTRPGDSSWQGITSAGVDASFDGQIVEVSDDTPTFAQPTIPVWKAQALVQASIEAVEDIPGLATELLMLFADAKDRVEGTAHMTGAGTAGPTGLFTALDANTNVEIVSDTAAAIFKADLNELYYSVPVRWRRNAKWVMNPVWALAIHDLGTAVSATYSGDLAQGPSGTILNKEVVETDDAPATTTTTVRDNRLVLGDLSQYYIVDKPGSFSVDFIPHLFNTTTNLPDGRRGWYAYWRTGGDSVVDTAFRLLQDKTSA